MTTVKLCAIGESVGGILPKELLAKSGVGAGDMLQVVEQPDGGLLLTPLDQAVGERQRQVGRDVMRRYRTVLRELAK